VNPRWLETSVNSKHRILSSTILVVINTTTGFNPVLNVTLSYCIVVLFLSLCIDRPPIAHPIAHHATARHPPAPLREDQASAEEEISPQVAQARMFGNVHHIETVNSTFNNSGGNQTNVDYDANPLVVPIYSGSPSSSPLNSPLPSPTITTTTAPGLPQQAPKPSKNPFTKMTQMHGHATVHAPVPDDMHTSGTGKIKTAVSDVAMSVAIDTMTLLGSAAKNSPVPFLGQASTAVLSLLATVQVRLSAYSYLCFVTQHVIGNKGPRR
jgi:hypothetical protein